MSPKRSFWLMKTEPELFSFEDLMNSKNGTTSWEGVRNYQARNLMRDIFRLGELVLVYHSNIDEPAIFGIAEVVREGYPDNTALDARSRYYDPAAAKKGISPWSMVDIKALKKFATPVTREKMNKAPILQNMILLQRGSRLSVQPVGELEFKHILKLGNPQPL